MSSTLRLRLRTSTGVRQIAVDADSTFHALRDVCAAAAAIDPATMECRSNSVTRSVVGEANTAHRRSNVCP